MSSSLFSLSLFSLIVGLILALSPIGHATEVKPEVQKVQLALNWKPEPQFGGFYAAAVHGHYAKSGLEVEVLPGGAGTPVVQMIAAGKVDFGIVSADEIVIAQSRGSDVVALFAAYQTNPQGIMTHEVRGFQSLRDVYKSEGIVALQQGLAYAMFLNNKFKPVKAQLVPYMGGIANFLNDTTFSQQCFVTSEPLAAQKRGKKVKTFLVADEGYNPYTTVLATRRAVLEKDPKLAKALVAAVREGWRAYLDNPKETNKMMQGLNKSMDAATFDESARAQIVLIETEETRKLGLGIMTEERWKTLSTQLLELKLIKKSPDSKTLFQNL